MTTEQIMNEIEKLVSKKYDKARIHELLIKLIASCYNNAKLATPAIENDSIVKKLADWSRKYPRERIYGMNRQPDMDGELIKLEEEAKLLFPLSDLPKKEGE